MTKGVLMAAVLGAAIFACGARAGAEPIDATLVLSVNPIVGYHEVGDGGSDRFSFAPLPLGELSLRHGADSIRIEGLPPIAFNYGNGPNTDVGNRTTRLSVLNATFRHAFAGGWFVGAGETAYTQRTDYTNIPSGYYYFRNNHYYFIDGSDEEYSRVGGLRIEAGRNVALGRDRLEAGTAVSPSMHGTDYLVIPTTLCVAGFPSGRVTCTRVSNSFADAEAVAQVDAYARIAHRISPHGAVLFGLRYINFTSRYSATGELADRNVGWAPTLGYRLRL